MNRKSTALAVRTVPPDYKFSNIEQWRRYITAELFTTSNKVLRIKAAEMIAPRINVTIN